MQRFDDSYVERLKQELLTLKKLATEYLKSLEDKQKGAIPNMALVRKLSGCFRSLLISEITDRATYWQN